MGKVIAFSNQKGGSGKFVIKSDGTHFSDDAIWADSQKAIFGTGSDLQIYHDGSASYIDNTHSGGLYVRGGSSTGYIVALQAKNSENSVKCIGDGAVELFYDANKKAETVTGGFTITGTCTATAYAGDGSALTGISAGATGGGSDEIFYENSQTVTTDYTITSNKNAMSAGPITINNGVSVTVPSGSTYTIV